MNLIYYYFVGINVVAFVLMGLDKFYSKANMWRIPELVLFLSALLGGSIGANLGMYVFKHKTKHFYFVIGMPVILILQIFIYIYFF